MVDDLQSLMYCAASFWAQTTQILSINSVSPERRFSPKRVERFYKRWTYQIDHIDQADQIYHINQADQVYKIDQIDPNLPLWYTVLDLHATDPTQEPIC